MIGKKIASKKYFKSLPDQVQIMLSSIVGASFIFSLVLINLVGYGIGASGVKTVMLKILQSDGISTLLVTYYFLVIGVVFMKYLEKSRDTFQSFHTD